MAMLLLSRFKNLRDIEGCPALCISAATGEGTRELLMALAPVIVAARAAQPEPETFVVHRPEDEGVHITRNDDGSWSVLGRNAERAVAVSDLNDIFALEHVHKQLNKLGVDKSLARSGARVGDIVHVGGFTFAYE